MYLVGATLALVAACVLPLATTLIRRGRQHLALILPLTSVPADEFALYLRSFTDDIKLTEIKITQRGAARGSSNVVTVPVARTEEEQIREAVRPFGPLIAVGSPGEPLPKLGARRGYLKHDSWQDTVLAMMQKAQLVLLGAGRSKSLLWEVTQAIAKVLPERLVLVIPMNHQEYLEFRQQLSRYFPRGLPDYPEGKTIKYPEKIRGAIYFTPDWYPFSPVSTWLPRGEINFALLSHTSSTVCSQSTSSWALRGLEFKTYHYSQPWFQKLGPCVNN